MQSLIISAQWATSSANCLVSGNTKGTDPGLQGTVAANSWSIDSTDDESSDAMDISPVVSSTFLHTSVNNPGTPPYTTNSFDISLTSRRSISRCAVSTVLRTNWPVNRLKICNGLRTNTTNAPTPTNAPTNTPISTLHLSVNPDADTQSYVSMGSHHPPSPMSATRAPTRIDSPVLSPATPRKCTEYAVNNSSDLSFSSVSESKSVLPSCAQTVKNIAATDVGKNLAVPVGATVSGLQNDSVFTNGGIVGLCNTKMRTSANCESNVGETLFKSNAILQYFDGSEWHNQEGVCILKKVFSLKTVTVPTNVKVGIQTTQSTHTNAHRYKSNVQFLGTRSNISVAIPEPAYSCALYKYGRQILGYEVEFQMVLSRVHANLRGSGGTRKGRGKHRRRRKKKNNMSMCAGTGTTVVHNFIIEERTEIQVDAKVPLTWSWTRPIACNSTSRPTHIQESHIHTRMGEIRRCVKSGHEIYVLQLKNDCEVGDKFESVLRKHARVNFTPAELSACPSDRRQTLACDNLGDRQKHLVPREGNAQKYTEETSKFVEAVHANYADKALKAQVYHTSPVKEREKQCRKNSVLPPKPRRDSCPRTRVQSKGLSQPPVATTAESQAPPSVCKYARPTSKPNVAPFDSSLSILNTPDTQLVTMKPTEYHDVKNNLVDDGNVVFDPANSSDLLFKAQCDLYGYVGAQWVPWGIGVCAIMRCRNENVIRLVIHGKLDWEKDDCTHEAADMSSTHQHTYTSVDECALNGGMLGVSCKRKKVHKKLIVKHVIQGFLRSTRNPNWPMQMMWDSYTLVESGNMNIGMGYARYFLARFESSSVCDMFEFVFKMACLEADEKVTIASLSSYITTFDTRTDTRVNANGHSDTHERMHCGTNMADVEEEVELFGCDVEFCRYECEVRSCMTKFKNQLSSVKGDTRATVPNGGWGKMISGRMSVYKNKATGVLRLCAFDRIANTAVAEHVIGTNMVLQYMASEASYTRVWAWKVFENSDNPTTATFISTPAHSCISPTNRATKATATCMHSTQTSLSLLTGNPMSVGTDAPHVTDAYILLVRFDTATEANYFRTTFLSGVSRHTVGARNECCIMKSAATKTLFNEHTEECTYPQSQAGAINVQGFETPIVGVRTAIGSIDKIAASTPPGTDDIIFVNTHIELWEFSGRMNKNTEHQLLQNVRQRIHRTGKAQDVIDDMADWCWKGVGTIKLLRNRKSGEIQVVFSTNDNDTVVTCLLTRPDNLRLSDQCRIPSPRLAPRENSVCVWEAIDSPKPAEGTMSTCDEISRRVVDSGAKSISVMVGPKCSIVFSGLSNTLIAHFSSTGTGLGMFSGRVSSVVGIRQRNYAPSFMGYMPTSTPWTTHSTRHLPIPASYINIRSDQERILDKCGSFPTHKTKSEELDMAVDVETITHDNAFSPKISSVKLLKDGENADTYSSDIFPYPHNTPKNEKRRLYMARFPSVVSADLFERTLLKALSEARDGAIYIKNSGVETGVQFASDEGLPRQVLTASLARYGTHATSPSIRTLIHTPMHTSDHIHARPTPTSTPTSLSMYPPVLEKRMNEKRMDVRPTLFNAIKSLFSKGNSETVPTQATECIEFGQDDRANGASGNMGGGIRVREECPVSDVKYSPIASATDPSANHRSDFAVMPLFSHSWRTEVEGHIHRTRNRIGYKKPIYTGSHLIRTHIPMCIKKNLRELKSNDGSENAVVSGELTESNMEDYVKDMSVCVGVDVDPAFCWTHYHKLRVARKTIYEQREKWRVKLNSHAASLNVHSDMYYTKPSESQLASHLPTYTFKPSHAYAHAQSKVLSKTYQQMKIVKKNREFVLCREEVDVYRFSSGTWKEIMKGDVYLTQDQENNTVTFALFTTALKRPQRVVVYQLANVHMLTPDMKLARAPEMANTWMWARSLNDRCVCLTSTSKTMEQENGRENALTMNRSSVSPHMNTNVYSRRGSSSRSPFSVYTHTTVRDCECPGYEIVFARFQTKESAANFADCFTLSGAKVVSDSTA